MADFSALMGELSNVTDQKLKLERYMTVLQDYVSQAAVPQLQAFVQHLVSEDVQLAVSRQVLLGLAKSMSSLAPEQRKEIGLFALEKVGPRVVSFEEQVSVIREELATIYEKEENWTEAAAMLSGIPLDSGIRVLDDNYKVEKYIKIAQLYLEDDEPVSAEGSINRASLLITEDTEPSLRLLHKARSPPRPPAPPRLPFPSPPLPSSPAPPLPSLSAPPPACARCATRASSTRSASSSRQARATTSSLSCRVSPSARAPSRRASSPRRCSRPSPVRYSRPRGRSARACSARSTRTSAPRGCRATACSRRCSWSACCARYAIYIHAAAQRQ